MSSEIEDTASETKDTRSGIKDEIISWVKTIVLAVIFAVFINNFIIVNAYVPSGSMENNIMTGDRLIASRISYIFSDPKRFDILVFRYPDDESVLYVKRLIGMPGDIIEIKNGVVYINDEILEGDQKFHKELATDTLGPFLVPENHYFMLGDNRNSSHDSPDWNNKFLSRDNILGKAVFRYFPNFKIFNDA